MNRAQKTAQLEELEQGLAKSGNAILLWGGANAFHTNMLLTEVIVRAATRAGVPDGAVQSIAHRRREAETSNPHASGNDGLGDTSNHRPRRIRARAAREARRRRAEAEAHRC